MRAQEPWQSRSPTGAVKKPLISSTLEKTGRRGLNHSYGRGLPVKRKALIILSIAILAFAMIPAIGAGAVTGQVKIVTPSEIVDPTNDREDRAFDQLESAEYVSTATGGATLEDTYGTLYVVIDDNDPDANALTPYTAIFNTSSTDALATTRSSYTLSGASAIHEGSHPNGVPLSSTAVTDTTNLNIGDLNRSGPPLTGDDIRVHLDYGTVIGERITAVSAVITSGASVSIAQLYEDVGALQEMRLIFYSASPNTLVDDDGDSRVQIRTSSDTINVLASEKTLSVYAGGNDDGLEASEFGDSDAVSTDSGVFVGAFGLIQNRWKEMLDEWIEQGVGNTARVDSPPTLLCVDGDSDGNCDDTDTSTPDVVDVTLDTGKVPAGTQNGTADDRDVTITLGMATELLGVESDQYIADRNEDGVVDHRDITVSYNNASGPGISVKSVRFVDNNDDEITDSDLDDADLVITVTLPSLSTDEAQDLTDSSNVNAPEGKSVDPLDTITFTYATTANLVTLDDDIGATVGGFGVDQYDHLDAFEDLEASPTSAEAGRLRQALDDQNRNLGALANTVSASVLINRLLGVTDGNDVIVRYTDASGGVPTERARVDLVAPTVSAVTPADNSFTTSDRIDGIFSVADAGAGIPEDAEDPTRNIFTGTSPFVTAAVTIDGNDAGSDDFDPNRVTEDDEIDDGFTYEYRIDIPRETARNCPGDTSQ